MAMVPEVIINQMRIRPHSGTLLLEGVAELPAGLESWFATIPRVDAYRAPANRYSDIIGPLKGELARNKAPRYQRRELSCALEMTPYPHQQEALAAWQAAKGRGVVVLPTGAGKTLVGLLALCWARRDGLIMVPTLDLMQQWYALLRAAFPDQEIGLIGGGYHEPQPLTIATYDSAARHIERLGDRFGLLIFDEVHHLPSEFYRIIAEFSLAPYRLGLTATPERGDGRDADLPELIGPIVYRKRPEQLAGGRAGGFSGATSVHVDLSPAERAAYQQALDERNAFLQANRLSLSCAGGLEPLRHAVGAQRRGPPRHARPPRRPPHRPRHPGQAAGAGDDPGQPSRRQDGDFHRGQRHRLRSLAALPDPCLTHQTAIKERQAILDRFKAGTYTAIVTSNVLNEGVDVPDASIGVHPVRQRLGAGIRAAAGLKNKRILRRGDGKQRRCCTKSSPAPGNP
jgi:superfamily II DNA or RNA helicase